MPRPDWIHHAAWESVEAAKAFAFADESPEILPPHLFQGLIVKAPDLIRTTLKELGTDPGVVESRLSAVPPQISADVSAGKMPVSAATEGIIEQARMLAAQHPAEVGDGVASVHLWVSVCHAVDSMKDWLKKRGWSEEEIRRLGEVSLRQLPSRAAGSHLQSSDLQILSQFCHRNLTQLALQGRLTPAFGVDCVREQVIRCLLKKNKRSVVLTGPAGVGKTKLVEDLAVRIINGEVPELAGCQVFELDLALFTQGTHLAGSRAERWTQLTTVLRAYPDKAILFIDELHSIVGLPLEGQAMDLANVLKPLLVDDKVRIIGATTSEEFRRYIEKDAALVRRFTEVRIPEPDREGMLRILRHVAPQYENHHGVRYSADALETIYELAHAYIPNQAFPAKAVDLVDEVGVCVRRERGRQAGPTVRPEDVRETLKRIWGVEPESLSVDLASLLKERVIGQDQAADRLTDVVIASACRYNRVPRQGPRGVILFLGPPGVGKSYMAQVFAGILFPGRDNLLTLDMTEFSGPHTGEHARFRLLGPPPPYVGWETGGLLTAHALQHPVSVVLIDEFEKADPAARNVLLRIFNDGWAQDGRGRVVSFGGIYFILTANAGHQLWQRVRQIGFVEKPERDGAAPTEERVREALLAENVAPEMLSRISRIVLFNGLDSNQLRNIAISRLAKLREAALLEDGVALEYDEEELAGWAVEQTAPQQDCRRLTAVLEARIETPLAYWRLGRKKRQFEVLRLLPSGGRIEIREDSGARNEAVQNLLFERVAALFARKEERELREKSTRVLLGTAS